MAIEFSPNTEPRYYARPSAYRCQIGGTGVASFPAASVIGAQASGTLTFSGQPANGSSVTINGVAVTFVTSGGFSIPAALLATPYPVPLLSAAGTPFQFAAVAGTGLNVQIGASLSATLMNLLALLRAWPDPLWDNLHFRLQAGTTLKINYGLTGAAGNATTLVASTSPASNCTVSAATLTGGTALTAGHAVLVEPHPHAVEIQAVWGITEASQAAGTATLYMGTSSGVSKIDAITWSAGSALSGTQEMSRLTFTNIAAATPLVVPPMNGLYAYGGTTQIVDLYAGPGGTY